MISLRLERDCRRAEYILEFDLDGVIDDHRSHLYVESILQRFQQDQYLYEEPDGTILAPEVNFIQFLRNIADVFVHNQILDQLIGDSSRNRNDERLRQIHQHGVENPMGALRDVLPMLAEIYDRLTIDF